MKKLRSHKAKNARRCDLIRKQFAPGGGLTPEEKQELAELQAYVIEWVNKRHPLPFKELDEFQAKVEREHPGLLEEVERALDDE